MKYLQIVTSLSFSLLFTFYINAQTSLQGILHDEDGLPLYGATVIESGTNNGVLTNTKGKFTLNTTAAFPIVIKISYVVYQTLEVMLEGASEQIFTMISDNQFDKIIIYASKKAEKLQEAPAAVSVISARQVTQSGGAITPIRALINSPGVELFNNKLVSVSTSH